LVQAEITSLPSVMISRLVDLEFCSAVSLKVRAGQLYHVSANRVLSTFEVHKAAGGYHWAEIGPPEYLLARQWISRFTTPLRTLDALHLAAAFANGIPLLTSDIKLSQAADQLGVSNRLLTIASP
jgi:predicted nucleic acid-binding protein